MYQVNAGRSLKTLVREADATILLDNDAWRSSGESVEGGYAAINASMAKRVGLLLAAGESVDGVAESVIDTSEVINTLRAGGMAAVGFSSAPAAEDAEENVTTVMSAVRSAVMTGMSLPNATDADAALVAIAGDPDRISRKGAEKRRASGYRRRPGRCRCAAATSRSTPTGWPPWFSSEASSARAASRNSSNARDRR